MSAVLQREIGAADSANAWTRLGKFFGVPGPLRCSVVAGRDDLTIAHDDAPYFSREAGGAERGRECQDHRVRGLVGPALLVAGMRLDGISIGRGPAGTTCRWPGGPGGHGWMLPRIIPSPSREGQGEGLLARLQDPGNRRPAMSTGADPRPVSRPEGGGGCPQVHRAVALVAERQLGRGARRVGDGRSGEAQREDISWLVHLSNPRNVQYSPACSRLVATIQ